MENVNMNDKVNINDEELEDVSGGIGASIRCGECAICGSRLPKVSLVNHNLRTICKVCLAKISNK